MYGEFQYQKKPGSIHVKSVSGLLLRPIGPACPRFLTIPWVFGTIKHVGILKTLGPVHLHFDTQNRRRPQVITWKKRSQHHWKKFLNARIRAPNLHGWKSPNAVFLFSRWVLSGCAGATSAVVGISAELIVFGCSGFVVADAGECCRSVSWLGVGDSLHLPPQLQNGWSAVAWKVHVQVCGHPFWRGNRQVLCHSIGLVSLVVPNVAAFVWPLMCLYPGLRRRLLGTAWVLHLLALASSHRKDFRFVCFWRHITVGWLMLSASTLRDEQSSVAALFQKFLCQFCSNFHVSLKSRAFCPVILLPLAPCELSSGGCFEFPTLQVCSNVFGVVFLVVAEEDFPLRFRRCDSYRASVIFWSSGANVHFLRWFG